MKVKETLWFNGTNGTCGIVLGEEDITGDPKAYIGVASGKDEKADTESIIAWGLGFPLDTALRLVRHLEKKRGKK